MSVRCEHFATARNMAQGVRRRGDLASGVRPARPGPVHRLTEGRGGDRDLGAAATPGSGRTRLPRRARRSMPNWRLWPRYPAKCCEQTCGRPCSPRCPRTCCQRTWRGQPLACWTGCGRTPWPPTGRGASACCAPTSSRAPGNSPARAGRRCSATSATTANGLVTPSYDQPLRTAHPGAPAGRPAVLHPCDVAFRLGWLESAHRVRHLLPGHLDIRVVQEILGHSTLNVTLRYTHVTSRLAREAADRMGNALWS